MVAITDSPTRQKDAQNVVFFRNFGQTCDVAAQCSLPPQEIVMAQKKPRTSAATSPAVRERDEHSEDLKPAVVRFRSVPVILDVDLARVYGVETKRLNEQVKRNAERFGEKYVFRLTKEEFAALRSQSATSNSGRGGRRYPPWAFTEYGVVMAATILDSDKAVQASKFVIDAFVAMKRNAKVPPSNALVSTASDATGLDPITRLSGLHAGIGSRLKRALEHVLDSVVDTHNKTSVREEAQHLISESIQHLKDRLKRQGLENEEIAARVVKLLAEAEREKAVAAKTRAESDRLEFATIVRKLRLLLEVQRALEHDRVDDFLDVLKEMSAETITH